MSTAQVVERPAFAHASEAELARILDFYQVRWEYEPDTFPIGWSMAGDVVESFSPDFYLPDMELYVELTTLKQKLVRKKNRKLRRLRELYPDIRIKLFYARDFRMLLLKFGRLGLLAELSGTIGQATPPRSADQIVSEAGGEPHPDATAPVAGADGAGADGAAAGDGDGAASGANAPGDAAERGAPGTTIPLIRTRRRTRRRRHAPTSASPGSTAVTAGSGESDGT